MNEHTEASRRAKKTAAIVSIGIAIVAILHVVVNLYIIPN